MKTHKKITTGFVIQDYVILPNGTSVCQGQEFIAGDQVDYENRFGDDVTGQVDTTKEVYCPFDMVQPKRVPYNPVKEAYENGNCPDCGYEIDDNVQNGDCCPNCKHVFWDDEVDSSVTG